MIDTHTHLYLPEFEGKDYGVFAVDRALESGVDHLILPNVDFSTVDPMKKLHSARPLVTSMAIGLHPTEVDDRTVEAQLEFVRDELESLDTYIAVGEVGIDLYWDKTHGERQMEVFEAQLQLAVQNKLPVIIHCRDGLDETLEVMQGVDNLPGAVFHSFGGTITDVEKVRRFGDFYFGINGIVTFKNSGLAPVLPVIGQDRLLLETDSPYLTPVPHRGKRNESSYLPFIAAKIADTLGMTIEEIDTVTTRNATELFHLG